MQIGEILGAAGVIITLVYLALQIRQNTRVARSSTRQAISRETSRLIDDFTNGVPMADIFVRSVEGEPLTKTEAFVLHARCFRDMKHWENIHYQVREGLFPEEDWVGFRQNLKLLLSIPHFKNYWSLESLLYSEAFQSEVTDILESIDQNPLTDTIVTHIASTEHKE